MTKADLVEKVTRLGDLTRRDGEVIVDTVLIRRDFGFGGWGQNRDPRFWVFPHPPAQSSHWPQPQDRRERRSPCKACSLLQTHKGTTRPGQSRRSRSLKPARLENGNSWIQQEYFVCIADLRGLSTPLKAATIRGAPFSA